MRVCTNRAVAIDRVAERITVTNIRSRHLVEQAPLMKRCVPLRGGQRQNGEMRSGEILGSELALTTGDHTEATPQWY